jgi:polyhydroxybutyrate depolymerase
MRPLTLFAAIAALTLAGATALAAPITVTVDGQARTALVQGTKAPGPHPTILMLHGGGGTAEGIAKASGLGAAGASDGFVAVFPEGMDKSWVDGRVTIVNRDQKHGVTPPNDFDFIKVEVTVTCAFL